MRRAKQAKETRAVNKRYDEWYYSEAVGISRRSNPNPTVAANGSVYDTVRLVCLKLGKSMNSAVGLSGKNGTIAHSVNPCVFISPDRR